MRYLGSKTLLLDSIGKIVYEYKENGIFCDPFGGIGTVGSFMKGCGYSVVSGDILQFAHFFQKSRIQNSFLPNFEKIKQLTHTDTIEELENYFTNIVEHQGWFIEEYSVKRQFFTRENAEHIQACIDKIWMWRKKGEIDEEEYAVLTASLIQSMDKVANTAGTYYAYLKKWYRKALKKFVFLFLVPTEGRRDCRAALMDANLLVKNIKTDILYLDPPYNERNYGRYYHLPETIAGGRMPNPTGKSGMYTCKDIYSKYNKKKEAGEAFEELIEGTEAGCIIFHYTDNGIIEIDRIRRMLCSMGKMDEYYFDSKGYNTVSGAKKCQHHIYRVMR